MKKDEYEFIFIFSSFKNNNVHLFLFNSIQQFQNILCVMKINRKIMNRNTSVRLHNQSNKLINE